MGDLDSFSPPAFGCSVDMSLSWNFPARAEPHWDFLPKFLSLHYYTTVEGVLGVQIRRQPQGTIICLFGQLFFNQNGMTFKKATKIIKIH